MAKPTKRSWEMLKRVGRYLKGKPRLVWQYGWQSEQEILEVHSDANWAGCKRSRKSSSGGTICLGNHLLKAYSKTQAVIAKSSGESELYGVIRASTEALGVSTLLEDFGVAGVKVRVGMDASAAMGIVQRRGLNKLRHVELDVLWIQEQQARRLLPLRKVPGPQNPSDLMTKHVDQSHIELYMSLLGLKFIAGRAEIAQKLHLVGEIAKPDNVHPHVCSAMSISQSGGGDPSSGRSKINPINSCVVSSDGKSKDSTLPKSELNRLHFEKVKTPQKEKPTAEDRHVDSWSREGKDGRWTRVHRSTRRALFTPFKVAGGPSAKSPLKKIRITRGKYLNSGKTFKIIDDWSVRANSHRMLESAWIGTTDFREASEFVDDDSDEEVEESATSPRLAGRESPSGCTSAEPQKERQKET
jgi:hypothetical protein